MITDYDGASVGLAFLTAGELWDLMTVELDPVGLEEWDGDHGGYIATYSDPSGAMLTLTMCPDWFFCCGPTAVTTVVDGVVDQVGPHQVSVRPVADSAAFLAETAEGWNFADDDGTAFAGRSMQNLQVSATWAGNGEEFRSFRPESADVPVPELCPHDGVGALASLTVRCDTVELRTTGITGQPWWRVTGSCGIPVTLAVPQYAAPDLRPGDTLRGTFRMIVGTGYWDTWDPANPSDWWTESPQGTVHDEFPQDQLGVCAGDWLIRVLRSATWLCAALGADGLPLPEDAPAWATQLLHLQGEISAAVELGRMHATFTDVVDVLGAGAAIAQDIRALAPDWGDVPVTTPQLLGLDHPQFAEVRTPTVGEMSDDSYLDDLQPLFAGIYRDLLSPLSSVDGGLTFFGQEHTYIGTRGLPCLRDLLMLGSLAVPDEDLDWKISPEKIGALGDATGPYHPDRDSVLAWYAEKSPTGVPVPAAPETPEKTTENTMDRTPPTTVTLSGAAGEMDTAFTRTYGETWTRLPADDRRRLTMALADSRLHGNSDRMLAIEVHDLGDPCPHGEIIVDAHALGDHFYATSMLTWETVTHDLASVIRVRDVPGPVQDTADSRSLLTTGTLSRTEPLSAGILQVADGIALVDLYDDEDVLVARVLADLDSTEDAHPVPVAGRTGHRGQSYNLSTAERRDDVRLAAVAVDLRGYATEQETRTAEQHDNRVPVPLLSPSFLRICTTGKPRHADPYAFITGQVLARTPVTDSSGLRNRCVLTVDTAVPLSVTVPETSAPDVGGWVTGSVRLVASTGPVPTDSSASGIPAEPPVPAFSGIPDLPDWWMGDILTFADNRVVERASRILDEVTVSDNGRLSGTATATVRGTHLYTVTLDVAAPMTRASCTCPHFQAGNYCKHLVATAAVLSGTTGAAMVGGYGEWPDEDCEPAFFDYATPEVLADFAHRVLDTDMSAEAVSRDMAAELAAQKASGQELSDLIEVNVDRIVTLLAEFSPPAGPVARTSALGDLESEILSAATIPDRILTAVLAAGRAGTVITQLGRLVHVFDSWRRWGDTRRPHLDLTELRFIDRSAEACGQLSDAGELDWAPVVQWMVDYQRHFGDRPVNPVEEFADVLTADAYRLLTADVDAWTADLRRRQADAAAADAEPSRTELTRQLLREEKRLRDLRVRIADATDDPDSIIAALTGVPEPELVTALILLDATGRSGEAGEMLDRILRDGALTGDRTTVTRLSVPAAADWMRRYSRGVEVLAENGTGSPAVAELKARLLLDRGDRTGAWAVATDGIHLRDWDARSLRKLLQQEFAGAEPATTAELHMIDARFLVDSEPDGTERTSPETMDRYRELARHLSAAAGLVRDHAAEFATHTAEGIALRRGRILRDVDHRYLLLALLAQEGEGPLAGN